MIPVTLRFWELYVLYFQSGFTDEAAWEEMNKRLLPYVDVFYTLKNPQLGLQEIQSFRVQAKRTVGKVEFEVGNLVVIDKLNSEFILINHTCVAARWSAADFAQIPLVEDGKLLLLPFYHIADTEAVQKAGDISQHGYMEWFNKRTLWMSK
ncbi:MAG: hypothetical protein V4686_00980 [Patescibacteria group bacterium]